MARANTRALAIILALSCVGMLPSVQAAKPVPASRFEVTAFSGYRLGGTLENKTTGTETRTDVDMDNGMSYGVAFNWEAEANSFYEFSYSRQKTTLAYDTPFDIAVDYLQIGGYATFAEPNERVIPYFLLTIGAARLAPDAPNLDAVTAFAAAIGGGIKVPFTSRIALRLDARIYAAFLDGDADAFCRISGDASCTVHLQGGTFLQPDVSLGFTFGF